MKTLKLILTLLLMLWALGPAASGAEEIDGASVYSDNCGRCHQPRAPAEFSDAAWAVIIHHMHVRGFLTESETDAVLKFLQSSNRTAPVVQAAMVAGPQDGPALVARYGCQGCHVIGGKGGKIGPVLDTVFQRRDADYVLQKLTNPKFDNRLSVMPNFGLSDAQKQAIVAHLKAVQR